jgi:hypothetical protein
MRLGVFPAKGISRFIVDHTRIECNGEAAHQSYIEPDGGCAACAHQWLNSLPFYQPCAHEDDLLRVEFAIDSKMEWYKKIVKDIWDDEGEEWHGHTVEFFGPRLWDLENPDAYPYWKIQDVDHPKSIIQLLRTRVCYEPQKQFTPIFLELRYHGFHVTSAIRGMDSDIEVGTQELQYLLRVRNRLFNLDSSPSLALKPASRGRRKGSGAFASDETFLIALRDVLQTTTNSVSEPIALERLSHHQLWQLKPLSLADCQSRRKTLRNWLGRSGLSWDEAKAKYCSQDMGK